MLSIGILTYNCPITLKNTLQSYKLGGLLKYSDDITCLIQPSNKSYEEIKLCEEYGIKVILEENNTMMSGGIKRLVQQSKYEYFLFLESDFRLCKNKTITKKILDFAIKSIKYDNFDVIRLRSLKNPGHPIHWNLQKRDGISYNDNTELYLCTHYLKDPHLQFPEYIQKKHENPLLYSMNSSNCVYTNNPNITSKKFYNEFIFPHTIDGQHLEPEIFNFWKNSNFNIGITSGIFTHARIDGHDNKQCYCCEQRYGGSSDNINCVCCFQPYRSKEFDKKDISNIFDDVVDEQYMNQIYNNLQFNYFSNNKE